MNIEEERKAFEAKGYPHEAIPKVLKFADGKYSVIPEHQRAWSQQLCDHANRLFPVWLAAKAHAAEMAKPVATWYETMSDKFALVCSGDNERRLFESVADAKVWAQANGYRVVDE